MHYTLGLIRGRKINSRQEARQSLLIVIDLTVPHTGVGFILSGVSDPTAAYMSFHNVISYGPSHSSSFISGQIILSL